MVKVRSVHSLGSTTPEQLNAWLETVPGIADPVRHPRLLVALDQVFEIYADEDDADRLTASLDILETLNELKLDEDALLAGLFAPAALDDHLSPEAIGAQYGTGVEQLLQGVLRMNALRTDQASTASNRSSFTSHDKQAENLRRMLVAMIDDPRVAVVKLAERIQALRACGKHHPDAVDIANECMDIYAPLAHRLGVGQIKWELEDLAFRYIRPEDYKRIAGLLRERRSDREQFIASAIERLSAALAEEGIDGQISGRPKHLYSIWRKMQRKGVGISELYDIRALRVLVKSPAACYTTLGVVHSLWRNIPREFDDYIANPKPNGYRSLHTAVIGDGGKVLEVQIRTPTMHEEAELGICAHWRYKESDSADKSSSGYEDKLDWLRQVLLWGEELQGDDVISEHLRREVGEDRIYALTPEGHVVDLPAGATPVDFAYHVHTEVGHRCRGAKVDGRIVSLDYALNTGERVEVITGKESEPNRDWMLADNSFVRTARARSKVRSWFRQQNREHAIEAGRAALDRELRRLAVRRPSMMSIAERFGFDAEAALFAAIGHGELSCANIVAELADSEPVADTPELPEISRPRSSRTQTSRAVAVAGADNLLMHYAGCCKPLPGDEIAGYITAGRGISIHQRLCPKFEALAAESPERLIDVAWQDDGQQQFPVILRIYAHDRTGLLRDIVSTLSNDRINIDDVRSTIDHAQRSVTMFIGLEVASMKALGRIMEKIGRVEGVQDVGRSLE